MVNKKLISGKEHVFPLTLTFAHVFISSLCDSMASVCWLMRSTEYVYVTSAGAEVLFQESEPLAHHPLHFSVGNCYDFHQAADVC